MKKNKKQRLISGTSGLPLQQLLLALPLGSQLGYSLRYLAFRRT
jgi:hypothetical protein